MFWRRGALAGVVLVAGAIAATAQTPSGFHDGPPAPTAGQFNSTFAGKQDYPVPTQAPGTSNNTAASTQFVQQNSATLFNVKAYGAVGNNINDDTSAIQAAINAAQAVNSAAYLPPGTFKTSALLTTGCGVSIRGAGSSLTFINQTSATAGGLQINNSGTPCNFNNGVAISGFQLVAGGGTSGVVNSTGTGLLVTQFNNGFSADDIIVLSFGTAVDSEDVWNSRFHGINGWWYNIGLQIGCNASYATAAGTEFSQVYFYNNPGPFGGSNVGLKECSSGGYIFKHAEFGSANTGILLQPAAGQQIAYDQWDEVIADTNLADGIDINCTSGKIVALTAVNVHSGFNNGVGLNISGSNSNCQALSFQGRFRENAAQGILASVGTGIVIQNSQVTANSRLPLTMTSGGTSYQSGDSLTLSGGTGGPITIAVLAVNGSGTITAWNVASSVYYSVLPSSPNTPTGGHGSGATFTFSATGYPLPGIETSNSIASFIINGNIMGNTASSSNAQGSCYKADTALFGQQFLGANICISAQAANYSGAVPLTFVSDTQFSGLQVRNSSNAVAAIQGNATGADGGTLNLLNSGTTNTSISGVTSSFLNAGPVTVGPSGITGSVGELGLGKISASGTAPGAGFAKIEAVAGTNAGSCKIIAYAGTSTTPVTILDNIGSGC